MAYFGVCKIVQNPAKKSYFQLCQPVLDPMLRSFIGSKPPATLILSGQKLTGHNWPSRQASSVCVKP
ncbi:MAG TPA: hypothetical protein VJQ54_19330, partial [Candidatus Sulfotelmatobacter sp.]|nr:hypothetical protein [Candidatus Sulfotelmatobacter sp.]